MKRGVRIAAAIAVAVLLVAVFAWLVQGKQIDVLQPAGVVAEQQRQILFFALFLSALVITPVYTLLIVFSIRYRAGNKKAKYDPKWNDNAKLEAVWWGIPIVIIGILGVLTFQTTHSLDPYKKIEGGKQVNVQVVSLQWKWLFIYPELNVATLNYVAMPVDRPVHFSISAESPMSALWIPALGSQIYAMNGMDSQLNLKGTKPGEYTGYNTNINGEGYSKMTFKAKVMKTDEYTKWEKEIINTKETLDMDSYIKLAKPESVREQRDYRLLDNALYDKIMKRNMSHGSHAHEGGH